MHERGFESGHPPLVLRCETGPGTTHPGPRCFVTLYRLRFSASWMISSVVVMIRLLAW